MPKHPAAPPRARENDLLTQPLGDELLVFDSTANRAHSLDATAAAVWQTCDGTRNPGEIAAHCQLDPLTVELALHDLEHARLLTDYAPPAERVSRRSAIRRMALTGATLGIAVPVIRSIVAPSAAMAASASRNSANGSVCAIVVNGDSRSSAPCDAGSVCQARSTLVTSSHGVVNSFVAKTCYRPASASCFYSSGAQSVCSSGPNKPGIACPSTGECPPNS